VSDEITETKIRKYLEDAMEYKDPGYAALAIRVAMLNGIEIHKMTDLHYGLMLLLAMPEQEKRGRPKDPQAKLKTWFLNMACKLKAEINGASFSKTWAAYCDHRTRPKATDNEIWRCAGILLQMMKEGDKRAIVAVRAFELTEADLAAYDL
tara:strand:+ start:242 stop:694 length:453 start_codon:yes stop_codon:yes gene_type:complete